MPISERSESRLTRYRLNQLYEEERMEIVEYCQTVRRGNRMIDLSGTKHVEASASGN